MNFHVSDETYNTYGIQSTIEIGEYETYPAIKKTPKWTLSEEEAIAMLSQLDEYRYVLNEAGIITPQNYTSGIISMPVGHTIQVIDEYISPLNLEDILKDPNTDEQNLAQLWSMMLDTAIAGSSQNRRVFLDMKPDNYVFDPRTNQLNYIDLIPPMLPDHEGQISNYFETIYGQRIKSHMTFNFGTINGQVTKLLALIRIQKPHLLGFLSQTTLNHLKGKIRCEDYEYINNQVESDFAHQTYFYNTNTSREDKATFADKLLENC
jgi:hypothetical protein